MKFSLDNKKLVIIVILQIIALIIANVLYNKQFSFKEFMDKLKSKSYDYKSSGIIRPFEDLFNEYYDNAQLDFFLRGLLSVIILIITVIELILMAYWHFKKNPLFKKLSFFLLFHAFSNMLTYLFYSFIAKYKVDLEDNEIYVFDTEFNKEIKKNLNFMIFRKIFLIIFSLVAIAGTGLIFTKIIIENKDDNSNNTIEGQQQIVDPEYNIERDD